MRLGRFSGFGAVPNDNDVVLAQQALNELTQSQSRLKNAYNSLVSKCGSNLDYGIQSIIVNSDADLDNIQAAFNDFLNGDFTLETLIDMVDGHVVANDNLIASMQSYGCSSTATGLGTISKKSGTTSGGGTTPGIVPLPGTVQAGLGSNFGLLAVLGLVGYFLYKTYSKKSPKRKTTKRKTTKRKTTRRLRKHPVRRRRRR